MNNDFLIQNGPEYVNATGPIGIINNDKIMTKYCNSSDKHEHRNVYGYL